MHTDKITLWNQKYSDQLKFLGFLIHDILVFLGLLRCEMMTHTDSTIKNRLLQQYSQNLRTFKISFSKQTVCKIKKDFSLIIRVFKKKKKREDIHSFTGRNLIFSVVQMLPTSITSWYDEITAGNRTCHMYLASCQNVSSCTTQYHNDRFIVWGNLACNNSSARQNRKISSPTP